MMMMIVERTERWEVARVLYECAMRMPFPLRKQPFSVVDHGRPCQSVSPSHQPVFQTIVTLHRIKRKDVNSLEGYPPR